MAVFLKRFGLFFPHTLYADLRPFLKIGHFLLWASLLACLPTGSVHAGAQDSSGTAFSFNDVIRLAEDSSKNDYQAPPPIPDFLNKLNLQQWEQIHFRNSEQPWPSKNRFLVRFYHLGYLYNLPVKMNIIDLEGVHRFPFSSRQFDYGGNNFAGKISDGLGFAGFVLSYPLNSPHHHDEILVFLGASYFRAVGKNQSFGLSARGIAIDTGSPSGEQFPYFKEFWLERPAAYATAMKIYALLDGRSVTGAYRFVVRPGDQTVTEIDSVLFLRNKVNKFGVAPFSSMFLQGSAGPRRFNTLSPQVHNSDGLSIRMKGDKWIWRPLQNPKRLAQYYFTVDTALQGFGLMQRDRKFCSYESLSLNYQQRPSAWVTPSGDWGKGRMQLIEIPTDNDNNDNIVAFWLPDKLPGPHQPIRYSYSIAWQGESMSLPSMGHVVNTLTGKGNFTSDAEEFEIDFKGDKLLSMLPEGISINIDVENGGKLLEKHLVRNPFINGLRLGFQIKPTGNPIQLRAFLEKNKVPLTETWDYIANPD